MDADSSEKQSNGTKRPRQRKIIFTKDQTARLEEVFKVSRYPDVTVVENLAAEMGVGLDKISNWFQNKRAREKRNQSAEYKKWMKEQMYASQAIYHQNSEHVLCDRDPPVNDPTHAQSNYGSIYDRKGNIVDMFQQDVDRNACRYQAQQMPSTPLQQLPQQSPSMSNTLPTAQPTPRYHPMTPQYQKMSYYPSTPDYSLTPSNSASSYPMNNPMYSGTRGPDTKMIASRVTENTQSPENNGRLLASSQQCVTPTPGNNGTASAAELSAWHMPQQRQRQRTSPANNVSPISNNSNGDLLSPMSATNYASNSGYNSSGVSSPTYTTLQPSTSYSQNGLANNNGLQPSTSYSQNGLAKNNGLQPSTSYSQNGLANNGSYTGNWYNYNNDQRGSRSSNNSNLSNLNGASTTSSGYLYNGQNYANNESTAATDVTNYPSMPSTSRATYPSINNGPSFL